MYVLGTDKYRQMRTNAFCHGGLLVRRDKTHSSAIVRSVHPHLKFEAFQNLDADPTYPAVTIQTVADSTDAIRTHYREDGYIWTGYP